jgi:tetratricopeptide (TPR) repeat protein
MRKPFVLLAVLMSAAIVQPASAQDVPTGPVPESIAPADPAARLQTLFAELKRERNEVAAQRIATRIANEWSHSGSATVDLMMRWSKEAMDAKKYDVALDFLDQVVTISPAYAEGWNRRATVHFMMNSFAKSMRDIDMTLRLEPRHFGALSGMAQIMKGRGSDELALQAYERVLEIYPMMRSAQKEMLDLADSLAGESI